MEENGRRNLYAPKGQKKWKKVNAGVVTKKGEKETKKVPDLVKKCNSPCSKLTT